MMPKKNWPCRWGHCYTVLVLSGCLQGLRRILMSLMHACLSSAQQVRCYAMQAALQLAEGQRCRHAGCAVLKTIMQQAAWVSSSA